jgi:hypothetical protein
VLPYPGIEEVLKIHVLEASIGSLQQFTTEIQIGDSSRPFKVTLVYMDPANTIMSTKMLINNLDLIVEDPTGSNVYYGNGIAGDDINNVEQVSLLSPGTGSGIWKIRVISDVLPESGDPSVTSYSSQPFSLIISAGDLTVVTEGSYSNSSTSYNPHSCSDTQQLISMTLYDNGGDGWGSGNSYLITNTTTGAVIQTGTMGSAIPSDLMVRSSFCLEFGSYSVALLQTGAKTNEMSLEINQCHLYLSEYQPTGTISITSATDCNVCSNYLLTMTLRGSLYGSMPPSPPPPPLLLTPLLSSLSVPYGWKNSSHYTVTQTKGSPDADPNSYLLLEGTLIASPFRDHSICLSDGTYVITMDDIPKSDDFLTDDDYYAYLQSEVGVEEYRIYFNQNKKLKMKANQKAIVTVTGTTATIKIKKPSNASKYQLSAGGVVGVVLTSVILAVVMFLVFFDTTASIQKVKRFLGMPVNPAEEGLVVGGEGAAEEEQEPGH